ncbi:unnamed protein product [Schistosoma bovis]|nr:unnamed protein product [Schistosoma bovis]
MPLLVIGRSGRFTSNAKQSDCVCQQSPKVLCIRSVEPGIRTKLFDLSPIGTSFSASFTLLTHLCKRKPPSATSLIRFFANSAASDIVSTETKQSST